MAVTTKKTFPATSNATTTAFTPVGIQLNNQDDLDVYVTLSGGTRVLQLRQATGSTAQSSHPQVNNTDGLYYPAVSAGTTLYNYQLSTDNNTITFNSALPSGAVVFCERRTRDADGTYTSFASGSTIRATDLNNSARESNFTAQEARNKAFDLEGKIYNTLGEVNLVVKTTDTGTVTSTMLTDGTIVNADINASADIQGSKLLDDSVTLDKLGSGALPTDITVASANIVDGTIVNADINTSAAIAGTKVTPAFGSQNVSTSGTLASGAQTVTGNIAVSGTVDGRDIATDGSKLDGIESGATADQNAAEIRALVESASDSNVFTDADHSKLNNIEAAATADQTASEIKTLLQSDKLELSEMNTTSLDSRYFTETESDARYFRQDSSETISSGDTWTGSDAYVATTGAIDARIVDLVDDVGGFVPLANETSFPTANPDVNNGAGTLVSIKSISSTRTPSSGTVTIANGAGSGNTVSITGCGSTVLTAGFGVIVETTSTLHTYAFHRLVPKATEVSTVAANAVNISAAGANVTNIDNFADRYQISTSAPTQRTDSSSLVNGDLWFDSSSNKVMMVYDGSSGDGFSPITPNASDLTNINIVAGQITYTEDLGLITNAVSTGTGNNSVNTVAGSISNVNTVAGSISNVNAVAGNATNINAVAADATDIGAVAGKATEIGRLGTADAVADMNTLGTTAIVSDMDTLADISSNITTVAGISANVTTVAGNNANVTTVAGNNSNITAVANNSSNINSAVSNASNINAAVSNASNINTVANVSSNVTTVAGSIANVNTTAGSIANVNTTAGSISNVNAVGNAIANVNTTASNIANVNNFAGTYQIASSNPSTDGNNNSLAAGDLYFNTASNELRVYNGSTWQGGVTATGNLAGLGANTFTGNISFSGSQTVDGRDVSVDGAKLDGIEAGATGDQTNAEIKTAYEANSNTNGFTDALLSKLNAIEAGATGDQTASEIVSLISGQTIAPNVITTTNLTLDFGALA